MNKNDEQDEEEENEEEVVDQYEGQDAAAAIKQADDILTPVGKKKIIGGNAEVAPGLYVIGTPVGNLSDITLRALHVLSKAELICCEDTRVTRNMLRRYNIFKELSVTTRHKLRLDLHAPKSKQPRKAPLEQMNAKLLSFHKHSHPDKIEDILGLLRAKRIVAIVSDSGTPAISDPGANLVAEAHRAQVPVFCVPGPSMPSSGLSVSGFPAERFIFEGFLPKKPGRKEKLLKQLAKQDRAVVFFESPFRIERTLSDCITAWGGEHEAVIVREMTKIHEEVMRGSLASLLEKTKKKAKGEYTVVIAPREEEKNQRKDQQQ